MSVLLGGLLTHTSVVLLLSFFSWEATPNTFLYFFTQIKESKNTQEDVLLID